MQPQFHVRRSPHLKDYDYAQEGAYFVTICTHQREWLFGEVIDGEMRLSSSGEIALSMWQELSTHYPNIELDGFVVMPNHVHAIVVIVDKRADLKSAPTHGLPEIMRGYKSLVTRRINERQRMPGAVVWHRSYHDHIIRHEKALNFIHQYVDTNPSRWEEDQLYRKKTLGK